jgi:hypothetical protein
LLALIAVGRTSSQAVPRESATTIIHNLHISISTEGGRPNESTLTTLWSEFKGSSGDGFVVHRFGSVIDVRG